MARPSMKRPGITMTGRQWQVVEALRADGWLILESDSTRWSDDDVARMLAALPLTGDPPRRIMRLAYQTGGTIEKAVTHFDHDRGVRVLELVVTWPGNAGYDTERRDAAEVSSTSEPSFVASTQDEGAGHG